MKNTSRIIYNSNKLPSYGVIFDQHYTDSLIRFVVGNERYKRNIPMKTKRSLPKKDILTSLLLFGKAYLSKPSWYKHIESKKLEWLQKEELIDWIPDKHEINAYLYLGEFLDRAVGIDLLSDVADLGTPFSYDTVTDDIPTESYHDVWKQNLDTYTSIHEKLFDAELITKRLTFLEPVLLANLNHLGYKISNYVNYFNPKNPLIDLTIALVSSFYDLDSYGRSEISSDMNTYNQFSFDLFTNKNAIPTGYHTGFDDIIFEADEKSQYIIAEHLSCQSAIFQSSMLSYAIESFSGEYGMPIKSATSQKSKSFPTIHSNEEYTLIKVQFDELRYPVVENLEDVLRLREDKNLEKYRTVIAEYSDRLRSEIEAERTKVISEFRQDIRRATKDLIHLGRWSKIENICFYISIPLAIAGLFSGIPLTDVLILPATLATKFVTYNEKKKLDWILFGRSN